jgi:hypothetical protein
MNTPVKTPQGVAELSGRQRNLSQRHRTALLLVDGTRSEAQIRQLALQAGCPASCFNDLIAQGMVAYMAIEPQDDASDLNYSVLPTQLSLPPSTLDAQSDLSGEAQDLDATVPMLLQDTALEDARRILIRAVRAEAPVAGALTLMRLRKVQSRQDIAALLDEVEQRITKPHKGLWATQTILGVRELLGLHRMG